MPTQEERINALERAVMLLQKRFEDADIQSVNHNASMLLGLVYGQQTDIREMKVQLGEVRQDIYDLSTKVDEHTAILNGHTTILNEHTSLLTQTTTTLNEHTALLTQILERLPKAL